MIPKSTIFFLNTWELFSEQKRLTSLNLRETYQGELILDLLAVKHLVNQLFMSLCTCPGSQGPDAFKPTPIRNVASSLEPDCRQVPVPRMSGSFIQRLRRIHVTSPTRSQRFQICLSGKFFFKRKFLRFFLKIVTRFWNI